MIHSPLPTSSSGFCHERSANTSFPHSMDSIISSSLELICSHGQSGLSLASLWTKLNVNDNDNSLKSSLYSNLLKIPSLQFCTRKGPVNAKDASIQSFAAAEKAGLKIVASSQLRDCSVGLYDTPSSSLPAPQRSALERLAVAKSKGITQSQLGKELGIEGNYLHYVLRKLEGKGLIVRQTACERTNPSGCEGQSNTKSHVTTNLIHLHRYAKHLGSQQKFEISKERLVLGSLENANEGDVVRDSLPEETIKEDVHIKDYIPAMKAICDKLEGAKKKVLVVSDIKRELGYLRSSSRQKAWKNICQRLKDAGIVAEFEAKVKGKIENCIGLLKKFSPKSFEPNSLGSGDNFDKELKFGRRFPKTEQLVELPIEHQIYDMVDAERSGMLEIKVFDRLGIDQKKNNSRFPIMASRFGMSRQKENYGKTMAHRVWTSQNFCSKSSNAFHSKSIIVNNHSTDKGDINNPEEENDVKINTYASSSSLGNHITNHKIPHSVEQELPHEISGMPPPEELDLVSKAMEKNISSSKTGCPAFSKSFKKSSSSLTPNGLRREQWILERLQVDKFILRTELQRWLTNREGKCTTIDRKCIKRILEKLKLQGRCKLLEINVPAATNFGSNRIAQVVLHPSVENLTPNLLGEIHDRLRSFEMQSRGSSNKKKDKNKKVPVLEGVQRTQSQVNSDGKTIRLEVLRANGFEPGKMVRAKLLHSFLWGYLSSSPGWDDFLSTGKHSPNLKDSHSCCNFSLKEAIMNIPLKLFLQVAGSTQKLDDMTEKCKKGLCLSDLPTQEYRCLMDTHAIERLSLIVDILRRLKLVRLVCNGHSDDEIKISHANLDYAMEVRPYIEEPNLTSLNLRRRIRHDFVLSNREAVAKYWQILEHCYAAADRKATFHAFPGSSVHEVFGSRSWASARDMTDDQCAEFLKSMVDENMQQDVSHREHEEIAKDLNLTVEQVLHMCNNKRQHLNRFHGTSASGKECQPEKNKGSSSRKRNKSLEEVSGKRARVDAVTGQPVRQTDATLPDTVNKFVEEHDSPLLEYQDDDHLETAEGSGPNEPTHQKRFSWTDKEDRKLVVEYVRYRAARGAKFHSVDWAALSGLPACPKACKRRMSLLRSNEIFRRALMNLCNMLSERFVKHLEKTQEMSLNRNGRRERVRCLSRESHKPNISNGVEHIESAGFEVEQWDDFEDKNIDRALEEVLLSKRMVRLEASKRVGLASEELSNENLEESGFVSPTTSSDQNLDKGQHKDVTRRSRLHKKFFKLLNEGRSFNRRVLDSLAVSNAIELLKLVFLSSSTSELPNLLEGTLRRYSEHDLFAAFSYLRDKRFMIGGNGKPFVLSQQFLLGLFKSPFPANTGKRAAEFSSWLYEREKDLREEGINLNADLRCGEFFHLFALVSSCELSIAPCLPDRGVGEAEDSECLKRRNEEYESCSITKKLKSLTEGDLVYRRKKGFPGIIVSVHREMSSIADTVELFRDGGACSGEVCGNSGSFRQPDYMKESINFDSIVPTVGSSGESPWVAMASYAEFVFGPEPKQGSSFSPQVFKAVHAAIQKAGDQGLSINEISHVVDMPGEKITTCIVDVLQAFGRALQANGYESVRVVDAYYCSKYFLTSMAGFHQDRTSNSPMVRPENQNITGANSGEEIKIDVNDVHKVTILNLPENVAEPLNETHASNVHEVDMQGNAEARGNKEGESYKSCSTQLCTPILPWMNRDGTVNIIVYNGLIRLVLGLVMQNPGILEDQITDQIDVLNPQSCKKLLEVMVLDKHLIVRKMHQTTNNDPPAMLRTLLGSSFRNSKMGYREHFFANPMNTSLL